MNYGVLSELTRHPPAGDYYSQAFTAYINGGCREFGENRDPLTRQPCKEYVLLRKIERSGLFKSWELEKLNYIELLEIYKLIEI